MTRLWTIVFLVGALCFALGGCLFLAGCSTPTILTNPQKAAVVRGTNTPPPPPTPPGMDAQAQSSDLTASVKPPCAGKSIITTNSTGYCFTNPCSLTSGCVTTQPPKTNMVFTWNCGQWWKPYHTGLINISDGTPICYIEAQPTNAFTTTNTGILLVRAYSTP